MFCLVPGRRGGTCELLKASRISSSSFRTARIRSCRGEGGGGVRSNQSHQVSQ
jgi:hypothetical protein